MMGGGDDNSNQPYPDIRSALTLTLLAMLAAAFTSFAFIDFGLLAAVGIGQAIGVGAVATMGAQRVAEPQAVRLGLRALDWKDVPAIMCLAPAILLVSELDNVAADWAGSDSPEEIATSIDGFDAGSSIQNDFDAGLPNEPKPGEGELAESRGEAKTEIGTPAVSPWLLAVRNVSTSSFKGSRGGGSLRGAEPRLMRVIKTIKQAPRREPEESMVVNRAASPFV
jgi:hypothetical protein